MRHKGQLENDSSSVRIRIEELSRQIIDWSEAYHNQDNPIVPDAVFDAALQELKELESKYPELRQPDSPTQRIGAVVRDTFSKHRHLFPMLSLANAFSQEDLIAFFERARRYLKLDESTRFECVLEEKMDGLALSLTYRDGILTRGTSRGDGEIGEDVSDNVRTLHDIPLRLKTDSAIHLNGEFEVRGEVFLDHAGFALINAKLEAANQKLFANPRNAAAGSLRLLDSAITASRPLRFYAYQIAGRELASQSETLEQLKKLGFQVNPHWTVAQSIAEIQERVDVYAKLRRGETVQHAPKLDYDIDGLVIKINDSKLARNLGHIANSPRWAVAYKLAPLEVLTQIESIAVQIGRTGAITPVANLKPVNVSGVVVSRATLHNEDQLRAKDVRVGDTVWIRRAGDVIPEIVRVDTTQRNKDSKPFEMPTHCPECKQRLEKSKSTWLCPNLACPAKQIERIRHFCSRRAMDIRGLGDQWIEKFIELGFIKKLSDIYELHLHKEALMQLEGRGEKSILKILSAIEDSKTQSPARLLYGLGIDLIGETTAEELINTAGSIDNLFALNLDELQNLPNVGPETARSVFEAAHNLPLKNELNAFKRLGLSNAFREVLTTEATQEGPLQGKTFVITGSLSRPRDAIRDQLKKMGATVTDSVSKNTNFLIAGEKAGSKIDKARKLGVQILSEEDLTKLFQNRADNDK